jgi:hypothetical protein
MLVDGADFCKNMEASSIINDAFSSLRSRSCVNEERCRIRVKTNIDVSAIMRMLPGMLVSRRFCDRYSCKKNTYSVVNLISFSLNADNSNNSLLPERIFALLRMMYDIIGPPSECKYLVTLTS